ncbi:MAG: hypothetical protein WCG79_05485 [Verrucomicrobiota bacterium]
MKTLKMKASLTTPEPFDFKAFSEKLREMSEKYDGIKLVSVGAMNGLNSGSNVMNYLAVWSSNADAK